MSVEACTLGREKAELLALHRDRRSGLDSFDPSTKLSREYSIKRFSIPQLKEKQGAEDLPVE